MLGRCLFLWVKIGIFSYLNGRILFSLFPQFKCFVRVWSGFAPLQGICLQCGNLHFFFFFISKMYPLYTFSNVSLLSLKSGQRFSGISSKSVNWIFHSLNSISFIPPIWALNVVLKQKRDTPQVYVSIFALLPHCLDYYQISMNIIIWNCQSCKFVLFQYFLKYIFTFAFPYTFLESACQFPLKYLLGFLFEIVHRPSAFN